MLCTQAQAWAGPLSRELLVFNGFVRALSRSLRTLVEVTALNMLLSRHARRTRDDLLDISLSLPFQADVNTGFGILAKVYLDATVMMYSDDQPLTSIKDANAEGVEDAKQEALQVVEETFVGVKNPRMEVERGFRFWDAVRRSFPVFSSSSSFVSLHLHLHCFPIRLSKWLTSPIVFVR